MNRNEVWKDIWSKKGNVKDVPLHHMDGFDLLTTEEWERMALQITRPLEFKEGSNVLECGCGAGAFLSVLGKFYPSLSFTGIDYSESLVNQAKANLKGTFYLGDMTDLKFLEDGRFDYCVSFSTFHYLSSEESAKKAVSEMVRLTKPGGMIYIGEVSDAAKREDAEKIRLESHKNHKLVSDKSPDHLFLFKRVFEDIAKSLDLVIKIVDHTEFDLGSYKAAQYRYSVYLSKKLG